MNGLQLVTKIGVPVKAIVAPRFQGKKRASKVSAKSKVGEGEETNSKKWGQGGRRFQKEVVLDLKGGAADVSF